MVEYHLSYSLHLVFCQPRVIVTSCFVYKAMGLTFHDRINTQSIYRFELAQVLERRFIKPHRKFFWVGISLAALFYSFFFIFGGMGGGSDFIILFMSIFFFLSNFYYFYLFNMY